MRHLPTMWIIKEPKTTHQPQPPSGGGGRLESSSPSPLARLFAGGCVILLSAIHPFSSPAANNRRRPHPTIAATIGFSVRSRGAFSTRTWRIKSLGFYHRLTGGGFDFHWGLFQCKPTRVMAVRLGALDKQTMLMSSSTICSLSVQSDRRLRPAPTASYLQQEEFCLFSLID
jgi:hypothetical protein